MTPAELAAEIRARSESVRAAMDEANTSGDYSAADQRAEIQGLALRLLDALGL